MFLLTPNILPHSDVLCCYSPSLISTERVLSRSGVIAKPNCKAKTNFQLKLELATNDTSNEGYRTISIGITSWRLKK